MTFEKGIHAIKAEAQALNEVPGVYRMLAVDDTLLYVGKAKALRRRVMSYTQPERLSLRIKRMVAETVRMEIIETESEIEALLLEANLIKKLRPKYNILMKDDKSFPYIHMTTEHDYPRVIKHRGEQKKKGQYFGPFASAGSVNETVAVLQKAFLLRNCTDAMFVSRDRPCLQYHIKRCTAPCVDYVSKDDYAQQVDQARDFLSGKSREIVDGFAKRMEAASAAQNYEEAALYRDRVKAMAHIQLQQDINIAGLGDADVFAIRLENGQACVQVFFFRVGQNFGNKPYFPRHASDDDESTILAAFLPQFYGSRPPPKTILVSHDLVEAALIGAALSDGYKVQVLAPQRGDKARVVDFVMRNAARALTKHNNERASDRKGLARVQEIFELDDLPERIEIYDNSHIQGTNRIGAMVVADRDGFRKNAYRKFNIKITQVGDDFAMMHEVITRRFSRAIKEGHQGDIAHWPDLVLIDGGIGQLNAVYDALEALGVADGLNVVAISKGPDRNAGREFFHRKGKEAFQLPLDDTGLMYLQRLRDESHRFAIGTHRAKRGKAMVASSLDDIPGIGPSRKKALLQHFGSGNAVKVSGLQDLQAVPGVSDTVAKTIYDYYHGS